MKQWLFKNWAYRLLSLFFAILLFMYVGSTRTSTTNSQSGSNNSTSLTSNRSQTFSVPLSLTVNSNKYFVTGYPQKSKFIWLARQLWLPRLPIPRILKLMRTFPSWESDGIPFGFNKKG